MLTDLPNVLTLARIAAIPVLVALAGLATPGADAGAASLFALAGITDWLDGAIARRRGQSSEFGRMLDPIADKLLVGATLLMLAGTHRLGGWGLYAAIIVLLREILVTGLREHLAGARVNLPVTRLAKWKTGVQMTALGMLLLGDEGARWIGLTGLPASTLGLALLAAAAALTLLTGWTYLSAGLRHVEAAVPGAGPLNR